jgi:hypothetical protein
VVNGFADILYALPFNHVDSQHGPATISETGDANIVNKLKTGAFMNA